MSDIIRFGAIHLSEEGDTVSAFTLNGAPIVQVQQLFRAATARPVARGNRQLTVTFTRTRRPHASAQAARLFMADHDAELATITTTDCEFIFRIGGSDYQRTLTQAVVSGHSAIQRGLTTVHTYTLVGATLQVQPA